MPHKAGIIGAGVIGRFHATAFAEMENADLVGVVDSHLPAAEKLAADFGCAAYGSLADFLAVPDMDVVTICTPSGNHLEPALAAIEAGKHLIVEKPLEISLERCDAMIEAAEKKGLRLTGVFQSRFHEAPRLLKRAVEQGRFGRLSLG
ncbi:MAG: Gfo/Idh/MocA family oxidoreductase, partial [Rhodospirillales bacterium]|nr:Gfo/Idh/MocA family oxidoreductase [Rhodospirillales bacterium]